MCLKIWYIATNWVDTTYLHLHTYFHNPPKKTGLNCGSMTCPTGGAPNINYGKNKSRITKELVLQAIQVGAPQLYVGYKPC